MRCWRERAACLSAAVAAFVCLGSTAAFGQALERHLPPPESPKPPAITTPTAPAAEHDARPLGADLVSLILLAPTSPLVGGTPAPGLDVHDAPRMDRSWARARLARFLGRPISRKLISQVEATIVQSYRRMGYPFVEVSTPEQEIDRGVLQLRIVEFRLGAIDVSGGGAETSRIESAIRLKPGEPINAPALLQDLDWLSRYPYRTITPSFTPGALLGDADLRLGTERAPPWQMTASYADDGSPATGWDRYSILATVGVERLDDLAASIDVTGSPDFWASRGRPFSQPHPQYDSAAGRITFSPAPRQAVELTVDAVESNETIEPFLVRQQTLEASLGYQTAVSNFAPAPGDLAVGVEAARQTRTTFFGGVEVLFLGIDVFQLYGRWSDRWADRFGASYLELGLHVSPGGLDRANGRASFVDFTNGRVTSASYAFATLRYDRGAVLPLGFALATDLSAQYAGRAIPDPEQFGIGGQAAVRGYSLDDGAFDDGLVLREEVRAPSLSLPWGKGAWRLGPMAFADLGLGRNEAAHRDTEIGSIGVGASARLGRGVSADVWVSDPLDNAKITRAGDWRLDTRIFVSF